MPALPSCADEQGVRRPLGPPLGLHSRVGTVASSILLLYHSRARRQLYPRGSTRAVGARQPASERRWFADIMWETRVCAAHGKVPSPGGESHGLHRAQPLML